MHTYSRRIYSECCTAPSRGGRKTRPRSGPRLITEFQGGFGTQGGILQRLRHLVRGLLGLCVADYWTALSHEARTRQLKRTNCEGSRTFGIRGGLKNQWFSYRARRFLINRVTLRVLMVTIAVYSYDYGYGRGYRYTFAKSTPSITRTPLLVHLSEI